MMRLEERIKRLEKAREEEFSRLTDILIKATLGALKRHVADPNIRASIQKDIATRIRRSLPEGLG